MGAFIAFSTQDSLWGQILFTFFGILVGCVLLAAIGKIFLSASRAAALPARLLIFVALMLALLKYNQQVMSAVNAPAELIGFLILPGFLMGYLGAAPTGRLALAIELPCFAALAALLILGTADVEFLPLSPGERRPIYRQGDRCGIVRRRRAVGSRNKREGRRTVLLIIPFEAGPSPH